MESTLELLEGVEDELMSRSFLFNDPVSYREGVGATAKAIRVMLTRIDVSAQSVEKPREEAS